VYHKSKSYASCSFHPTLFFCKAQTASESPLRYLIHINTKKLNETITHIGRDFHRPCLGDAMVLCASLPLELTGSISTKNKTNPGSQSRNLRNLSDVDKERQKQRQICGADAAERRREFDLLMNKMRMGQKEAVNPRVEKPRWGAAALEDGAGPKPTSSSGVTHQELREAATRYAEAWARLMVRQLGFRFTPIDVNAAGASLFCLSLCLDPPPTGPAAS
jgi:hypothetical protein